MHGCGSTELASIRTDAPISWRVSFLNVNSKRSSLSNLAYTPLVIDAEETQPLSCTCFGHVQSLAPFGNPLMALFGVAQTGFQIETKENNMLALCSLLARRLLLLEWKDPTHSHWIREIMFRMKLDIRCTIRGSNRKCYDIWQPFPLFVEDSIVIYLCFCFVGPMLNCEL